MNKFRSELEYYVGIFISAIHIHMYNTYIHHNMPNYTLYSQYTHNIYADNYVIYINMYSV